ncbi:DUF3857 domain-containing protein [Ideonella livida]|uniref:DUF3857 domain-containing protein n=1 Tax=Ideonella livida TaxID=2707176 RepID=A0A7C9PFY5_9BURK|nr:DUF3857 domain-containing protein [Ideonella livida]NDY90591.1 DUF3857 domain-containing protein [Ideonella livida]
MSDTPPRHCIAHRPAALDRRATKRRAPECLPSRGQALRVLVLAVGLAAAAMPGQAAPSSATKRAPPANAGSSADAPADYQVRPTPDWVVTPALAELEKLPVASAALQVLLQEDQTRLGPQGAERYVRVVRRLQDRAGLESGAQWQIDFDPSYQRLVLHTVAVWRDGRRQDRLPGLKVKMLQRETQLERQIYDGRVTASIVPEDIRVGDRMELAYSLVGENPVFRGRHVDMDWSMSHRGPVAWSRQRLLVPAGRTIQLSVDERLHQVSRQTRQGQTEIWVERRQAPMYVWENQSAPAAYLADQQQYSEFERWEDVAGWAERLFEGTAAPGAEVLAQAQRLRRATPRETVEAVLDFVQQEIRYFGTEIGPASHQPAAPEKVLRQRFGDCKDKVALAVALLRPLGVAAEPLLVSTLWRGDAARLLPSPLAFNHAILTVPLDGRQLVLDPTRSLQSGPLEARQSLGLGVGLPARAGAGLMTLPAAVEHLKVEVSDLIRFERLSEDPVLEARWTYHGENAEQVRQLAQAGQLQELQKWLAGEYARSYPGAQTVGELSVENLAGQHAVRLSQRFALHQYLKLAEEKYLQGEFGLVGVMQALRLPDQAPRTRDLSLGAGGQFRHVLRMEFPEDVFSRPGQTRGEEGDRHTRVRWRQTLEPRAAEVQVDATVQDTVITPTQWQAHREALVKLWPRLSNQISLATLRPAQADVLRERLRALDAGQNTRVSMRSQVQRDAQQGLLVVDAQLQSGRLPTPAQVTLLRRKIVHLDHLGRPEEGREAARQALALDPQHLELREAAAENALALGDAEEALRLVGPLLEGGTSASAQMVAGRALYQAGEVARALQYFQRAVNLQPEGERAYALIWERLAMRRLGQTPPLASPRPTGWPGHLLALVEGRLAEPEARVLAMEGGGDTATGQRCELFFYLAELQQAAGDSRTAMRFYQQAVDTQLTEFVEHGMARLALKRAGAAR